MKKPTLLQAISALVFMFLSIAIGNGVLNIGVQQLLILSAAYVACLGVHLGYSWADMEEGISEKLKQSMPTMFIIMSVGVVIGTWIFSGTVPMMIYYGLKLINPSMFLVTAFLIVAIVSVTTGTAWGSTATAGVALMVIAEEMGIPLGMAAGAVISGGVFGDKMSPLSDTTNLAPLVCGVNLFTHIRHMFYTTIPSALIGLAVYYIAGRQFADLPTSSSSAIVSLMDNLDLIYNWNLLLLLPVVVIVVGSLIKKPTVPLMLLSSVIAVILGVLFHGFTYQDGIAAMMSGFTTSMVEAKGMSVDEVLPEVVSLINRGGISAMMNIVITIFCGYAYAGILGKIGCLETLVAAFGHKMNKPYQVVGITILGSLMLVFTAGVASVSIIMMGTLMTEPFQKLGLKGENLSRTLEDAGTMMLPFVPWGASGIFYLEVLGVGPADYWMWAILCYLCVVVAMICALTGFGIARNAKIN